MKKLRFLIALFATSACHDQITARQTIELLSRWDSLRMQTSEEWLAIKHSSLTLLPHVPAALRISVQLDRRGVQYRAFIFENHRLNPRSRPGECAFGDNLALVLWRPTAADTLLDVISTTIEAEPGPMEGVFDQSKRNSCGWRSPNGAAYLNWLRSIVPGTERLAVAGRFRVTRLGKPTACVFIKDVRAFEYYGAMCETRQYRIELDATLSADRLERGAAGGATHIRVSSSNLPGASFTIDCTKTEWSRLHCG